jgi:hypothetical protein
VGFKFGTYIEADNPTKNMTRLDVPKIKIATDSLKMIDSSNSVSVLNKSFVIQVMEDTGGTIVDELRCCGGCGKNFDNNSDHGSGNGGIPVVVVVVEKGS